MLRTFFILLFFLILSGCSSLKIKLKGEMHKATTTDGWDLTLERFVPTTGPELKKKYPIIICHGFSGNRNYFKINEEKSIATQLASAGYDVWLIDLRGRQEAGSPGLFIGDKTYSYDFDSYVRYDVDAAIKYVLAKTGAEKVNWIGHSMGGMVIYARAGSFGENRIANLVTIGSPFYFGVPTNRLQRIVGMNSITAVLPNLPLESLAGFDSYIWNPMGNYTTRLYYYKENINEEDITKLKRFGVTSEAKPVARQFSDAIERKEMFSQDRTWSYTRALKNIAFPVMVVGGRRDHLAPGYAIRYVYDNIGSKDKSLYMVGKSENAVEDYGHVDLIIGKEAHKDVTKPIQEWLDKRN